MTGIEIAPGAPLSDEGRRLIAASEASLRAVFPPEECFSFSPEELAKPATTFLIARAGRGAVGCVALVDMGDYGEIKRLYVDPGARGAGIADALMDALEARAAELGLDRVRLESGEALTAAMRLYRRRGYVACPAFGGYPDIASNAFLEKRL